MDSYVSRWILGVPASLWSSCTASSAERSSAICHCEGVEVVGQPAAGKRSTVGPRASRRWLLRQRCEVIHLGCRRTVALARRRARWRQGNTPRLLVKRVARKRLDGIKGVLALKIQTSIAAHDAVVSYAVLCGQCSFGPTEHGLPGLPGGHLPLSGQPPASSRRRVV